MTTVDWKLPEMVSNAYAPLFNSNKRYIAYKGSRGSGKSEATATKVIYDIVTKRYVNWLVLRRYANTNRQSTFTLIQKVATRMGVAKLFQFNGSLPEITYKPTGKRYCSVALTSRCLSRLSRLKLVIYAVLGWKNAISLN